MTDHGTTVCLGRPSLAFMGCPRSTSKGPRLSSEAPILSHTIPNSWPPSLQHPTSHQNLPGLGYKAWCSQSRPGHPTTSPPSSLSSKDGDRKQTEDSSRNTTFQCGSNPPLHSNVCDRPRSQEQPQLLPVLTLLDSINSIFFVTFQKPRRKDNWQRHTTAPGWCS